MNYKTLTIIALVFMLALVIPTSAVWSNGNYVTDDEYAKITQGDTVKFDPATGVTSKYNDNNQPDLMTYSGHVYGNLKSGGVLEGGTRFLIRRDGTNENESLVQYFGPDGLWDGYLATGEYTITLPQGTGSAAGIYSDDWGYVGNIHPEVTHVSVGAGHESYFTFIGNSIATTHSKVCVPDYTILRATYGFGHESCQGVIVHHGDYTKVHHDATPGTPDTYEIVTGGYHTGHCKVTTGSYDFQIGSTRYRIGSGMGYNLMYLYTPGTPGTPAYDEYVFVGHNNGDYDLHCGHFTYVAPTTENRCTTDGTVIDVTGNVQSVVDGGSTQFKFLFDNAQHPGGIFDATGTTLLSQIADPAPGFVKSVVISYNDGCGNDKTIQTQEYKVIDLVAGTTS